MRPSNLKALGAMRPLDLGALGLFAPCLLSAALDVISSVVLTLLWPSFAAMLFCTREYQIIWGVEINGGLENSRKI